MLIYIKRDTIRENAKVPHVYTQYTPPPRVETSDSSKPTPTLLVFFVKAWSLFFRKLGIHDAVISKQHAELITISHITKIDIKLKRYKRSYPPSKCGAKTVKLISAVKLSEIKVVTVDMTANLRFRRAIR